MTGSTWARIGLLAAITIVTIAISLVFVVLHHEDGDNRIAFSLTDHNGIPRSHEDYAGQRLLVFFGFTSCHEICPTQMARITTLLDSLEARGHEGAFTPVFVSVDPERDTTERVASYLAHFHSSFVGLTGSRAALAAASDRFSTILDGVPKNARPGYQLTHSTLLYVVDDYSRLVEFISFEDDDKTIVDRLVSLTS